MKHTIITDFEAMREIANFVKMDKHESVVEMTTMYDVCVYLKDFLVEVGITDFENGIKNIGICLEEFVDYVSNRDSKIPTRDVLNVLYSSTFFNIYKLCGSHFVELDIPKTDSIIAIVFNNDLYVKCKDRSNEKEIDNTAKIKELNEKLRSISGLDNEVFDERMCLCVSCDKGDECLCDKCLNRMVCGTDCEEIDDDDCCCDCCCEDCDCCSCDDELEDECCNNCAFCSNDKCIYEGWHSDKEKDSQTQNEDSDGKTLLLLTGFESVNDENDINLEDMQDLTRICNKFLTDTDECIIKLRKEKDGNGNEYVHLNYFELDEEENK